MILEAMNVESTIDRDGCAGGEVKQSGRNGNDCPADIFGLSPAPNRCEAFGDQFVVFLLHGPCHISLDDSGLNLIDGDVVFRESIREQSGHHREARFRYAVLTACH